LLHRHFDTFMCHREHEAISGGIYGIYNVKKLKVCLYREISSGLKLKCSIPVLSIAMNHQIHGNELSH